MTYLKKMATPFVIILLMSCAVQNNERPKIKQGVYGNVTWLEGNMMPSPDEPRAMNGRPIERTITIYAIANLKDVIGQAPLFTAINKKLVKTVKTNKSGYYECELPPGFYSVFSKESENSFFANSYNGKGEISSVEVKSGVVAKLDIVINYKAAY